MSNYDELIIEEIKGLLIKMHKGESLVVTLNKLMEMVKGIRYVEERKFIYLLQGLHMEKIGSMASMGEDPKKIEGFNEAAAENNFAVDLAISAITGRD